MRRFFVMKSDTFLMRFASLPPCIRAPRRTPPRSLGQVLLSPDATRLRFTSGWHVVVTERIRLTSSESRALLAVCGARRRSRTTFAPYIMKRIESTLERTSPASSLPAPRRRDDSASHVIREAVDAVPAEPVAQPRSRSCRGIAWPSPPALASAHLADGDLPTSTICARPTWDSSCLDWDVVARRASAEVTGPRRHRPDRRPAWRGGLLRSTCPPFRLVPTRSGDACRGLEACAAANAGRRGPVRAAGTGLMLTRRWCARRSVGAGPASRPQAGPGDLLLAVTGAGSLTSPPRPALTLSSSLCRPPPARPDERHGKGTQPMKQTALGRARCPSCWPSSSWCCWSWPAPPRRGAMGSFRFRRSTVWLHEQGGPGSLRTPGWN